MRSSTLVIPGKVWMVCKMSGSLNPGSIPIFWGVISTEPFIVFARPVVK